MGYHTIVVIQNDYFHEICGNPSAFVDSINEGMNYGPKQRLRIKRPAPFDSLISLTSTVGEVLKAQHNDVTEVVLIHNGQAQVILSKDYIKDETEESVFRALAEKYGYVV